jgi:hypothetical protein
MTWKVQKRWPKQLLGGRLGFGFLRSSTLKGGKDRNGGLKLESKNTKERGSWALKE